MDMLLPFFLRICRQEERERDFTARQIALLLLIQARGPMTVRALAAELKIPKPSVTRALDALQAVHFIRRREDPNDKRSILAALMRDGEKFLASLVAPCEATASPSPCKSKATPTSASLQ